MGRVSSHFLGLQAPPSSRKSSHGTLKMRFLVLFALVSLALGWEDQKMTKQWEKMKVLESCWGEENMKKYTVNIKKAIATCNNEDAPELFLPPYRSSYAFVNSILNGADRMENSQYRIMENMIKMMQMMQNQNTRSTRPYSANYNSDGDYDWMDKMKMKFMMKQMMEDMMKKSDSSMTYSHKNDDKYDIIEAFRSMMENYKMDSHHGSSYKKNDPMMRMNQLMEIFSNSRRSKRQAGQGNLDLGDRLVEKLNEQKKAMEAKVGNMTCVLKQLKCLDKDNNIDVSEMKKDMEQYTMPSPWFADRYEEILDTCHDMATNLPDKIEENSVVTGEGFGTVNLAQIKSFMKCCSKAKTRLCMHQDIKKKIETNFGPLEDILGQTQLTEYQIFPLVIQLLHGQEMDYMMGEM